MELNFRYVFHMPLYKYVDNELTPIEIDAILEELIADLNEESFYIARVESHYKSRKFDELLLTVFTASAGIEEVFKKWFFKNNHILCQEAFSFELNNTMYIEKLGD